MNPPLLEIRRPHCDVLGGRDEADALLDLVLKASRALIQVNERLICLALVDAGGDGEALTTAAAVVKRMERLPSPDVFVALLAASLPTAD